MFSCPQIESGSSNFVDEWLGSAKAGEINAFEIVFTRFAGFDSDVIDLSCLIVGEF